MKIFKKLFSITLIVLFLFQMIPISAAVNQVAISPSANSSTSSNMQIYTLFNSQKNQQEKYIYYNNQLVPVQEIKKSSSSVEPSDDAKLKTNYKKGKSVKKAPVVKKESLPKDKIVLNKMKPKFKKGELIIRFKKDVSPTEKSRIFSTYNLSVAKYYQKKDIYLVKLKNQTSTELIMETLKSNPNIELVQPNYLYYISEIPNDPLFTELWGLKNDGQAIVGNLGVSDMDIDAEKAWDITKGNPDVVVAVIDSGVDKNHPELKNNIWINPGECGLDAYGNDKSSNGVDDDNNGYVDDYYGWDFCNNDNEPLDDNGHGTHVAGTIAAAINNNEGVVGVAPNVKIMPLKVFDSTGYGDTFLAVMAIDYAVAHGAKISNNSWGGYGNDTLLEETIKSASNMLFICAAGNEANNNDEIPSYPSSYDLPNIISVAAIDNTGNIADFSNYGIKSVDVAAPGVNILSTIPKRPPTSCAVASPNTFFMGFGLESIESVSQRTYLMNTILTELNIQPSDSILLVQDDQSDTTEPDVSSYYENALINNGFTNITKYKVPSNGNGPTSSVMNNYKLVVWFTGFTWGYFDETNYTFTPNITPVDQENLKQYLNNGGKLILAGRDAGLMIEDTDFYLNYLHAQFISEYDDCTAVQGVKNTRFEGFYASLIPTMWLDGIKPSDNIGKAVLEYPESEKMYEYLSGTSMATPHVTGIAALLLSKAISENDSVGQEVPILKIKILRGVKKVPQLEGLILTGGIADAYNSLQITTAELDDDIPGVELKEVNNGTLNSNNDTDDVYYVDLNAGDTITLTLNGDPGTDFDLHLYSPYATTVYTSEGILASSENEQTSSEKIVYTVPESGRYYVDVYAYYGVGNYTLTFELGGEYDDRNPRIQYVGAWQEVNSPSFENGTAKTLNSTGRFYIEFTGSKVQWYAFKDNKQGIAAIYIDNVFAGEVNLYSIMPQYKVLAFEKALPYGQHRFEVRWTGKFDRSARKTATSINIDKIVISSQKTPPPAPSNVSLSSFVDGIGIMFNYEVPNNIVPYFKVYRAVYGSEFTYYGSIENPVTDNYIKPVFFFDSNVTENVDYCYKVTAVNIYGLESEPSNIVIGRMLVANSKYYLDDTNKNINYIGNWQVINDANKGYYNNTLHVTLNVGDKAEIPFIGYKSQIYLRLGPDMGTVKLTHFESNTQISSYTINLYSPNEVTIPIFGINSPSRRNGKVVLECMQGKINFDYEYIADIQTSAPNAPTNLIATYNSVYNSVSLTWNDNPELDIAGYNIYRAINSQQNYVKLNSELITTPQYEDKNIQAGTTYYYIVKAVNYAAYESAPSNEVTVTIPSTTKVTRIEENNSFIKYSGTWNTATGSGYSGGSCKYSNTVGSSIEFTFIGNGIRWLGFANAAKGIAKVTIDGVVYTVDTYSPTAIYQKVMFEKTDLTFGQHTIKIEVTGQKHPNATDTIINFDAFEVLVK